MGPPPDEPFVGRKAGYLEKKKKKKKKKQPRGEEEEEFWQRRYFVLEEDCLLCYASDLLAEPQEESVLAAIDIVQVGCTGPAADDEARIINLRVFEGSIKLRAPSVLERERWIQHIQAAQLDASIKNAHRIRTFAGFESAISSDEESVEGSSTYSVEVLDDDAGEIDFEVLDERTATMEEYFDDDEEILMEVEMASVASGTSSYSSVSAPPPPLSPSSSVSSDSQHRRRHPHSQQLQRLRGKVERAASSAAALAAVSSKRSSRGSAEYDDVVDEPVAEKKKQAVVVVPASCSSSVSSESSDDHVAEKRMQSKLKKAGSPVAISSASSHASDSSDDHVAEKRMQSKLKKAGSPVALIAPAASSSSSVASHDSSEKQRKPAPPPAAAVSSASSVASEDSWMQSNLKTPAPPPAAAAVSSASSVASEDSSSFGHVAEKRLQSKLKRATPAPSSASSVASEDSSIDHFAEKRMQRKLKEAGSPPPPPPPPFVESPSFSSPAVVRISMAPPYRKRAGSDSVAPIISQRTNRRASVSAAFGELEDAARWIEASLNVKRPKFGKRADALEWLRSGEVLCDLLIKFRPGCISKVNRNCDSPAGAFKQIDNIGVFIEACRSELQIGEASLFESVDLFERKGVSSVVQTLNAVYRAVHLGTPRPSTPKISSTHFDQGRKRSSGNMAVEAADKSRNSSVSFDEKSRNSSASSIEPPRLESEGVATVVSEHFASDVDELTVFIGDVVDVKLSKGKWSFAEGRDQAEESSTTTPAEESSSSTPAEEEESSKTLLPVEEWVLVQKGEIQGLVPSRCLRAGLGEEANILKAGAGHGDSYFAAKNAAKYDPYAEALAQHWIESVTGHIFRESFASEVRDGVLLCQLLNGIKPKCVAKPYEGDNFFKKMENVTNFLKAIKKLGVAPQNSFDTVDLFELKDLTSVLRCLHALSNAVQQNVTEFNGPYLTGGQPNKRRLGGFSEAVMQNLKVIVAVGEYRDRIRHERSEPTEQDNSVIAEAVEYRLAMLGLEDSSADIYGVDRHTMEQPFLVLWSTSTKHSSRMEAQERQIIHLLNAKKKSFEMVYVDVSPDRGTELDAILGTDSKEKLPALTFGDSYHGDLDAIQQLEDEGRLELLLEQAPAGEGFWALPEAWGSQSALMKGGIQVRNRQMPTAGYGDPGARETNSGWL